MVSSSQEKSDNKCDEDVLIQFGSLLAKGDPRALVAQVSLPIAVREREREREGYGVEGFGIGIQIELSLEVQD